ncbi:MAG: DUF1329 domain-containing protein [Telluria sp.]
MMKKKVWSALMLAFGSCVLTAHAAPSAAELEKLGKELTPVGAERAGNKDGSIPAWGGATAKPQGNWSWGKNRGDYWKHKGEKSTLSIDASNVDRFADKLSPGQLAMVKQVKGYKMNVFPTQRDCSYPDFVLSNTATGAVKSKIAADGWSLEEAALPGVPFPLPKSGIEVIWNYLMRYQGVGIEWLDAKATVSPRPGTTGGIVTRYEQAAYYPWGKKGTTSPSQVKNVQQGYFYGYKEPVALAGQALVQQYFTNKDAESFYYFTGQRRVRRLPNYAYDTPIIGFENQLPNDAMYIFYGNPDRFDWKLVGKKEVYIQYNNFEASNPRRPSQGTEQAFIDNDLRRYELHRVWVVEGNVKQGVRHSSPKKVIYFDEDTWLAVASEDYDSQGKLWRHKEAAVFPAWEIGACTNTAMYFLHDLVSGRYVTDSNVSGGGKDIRFYADSEGNPRMKDGFYTSENLRAISDR